jgi:hypothetical protein
MCFEYLLKSQDTHSAKVKVLGKTHTNFELNFKWLIEKILNTFFFRTSTHFCLLKRLVSVCYIYVLYRAEINQAHYLSFITWHSFSMEKCK